MVEIVVAEHIFDSDS